MPAYADSSFLVSLYTPDVHSGLAARLFRLSRSEFVLTRFGEFELINAFLLRSFRKELRPTRVQWSMRAFAHDIRQGLYSVRPLPAATFDESLSLASLHTTRIGCRALDIMHVASALALRADIFYTFDVRQRKLARAAGLRVRPAR